MADDPLALLVDELRNDDLEVRVAAMKRVRAIAFALGPDRARGELLPFLTENAEDEDEIMAALAGALGEFVDLVGGPAHAACLLAPLENLARVEETVVRDAATASIKKVAAVVTDASPLPELVLRLAAGDWFTARVSACALFAAVYARATTDDQRRELRTAFEGLARDDTPMVRRAAASNVGEFVVAVPDHATVIEECMGWFAGLCSDEQDNVRVLAVESTAAVANLLSEAEHAEHIVPIVRNAIEDRSWRVRCAICKHWGPLAQTLGGDVVAAEMLPHMGTLLQDTEAEVRCALVKNLAQFAPLAGGDAFVADVAAPLALLAQDQAQNVRVALVSAVMDLAEALSPEAVEGSLIPLVLQFLNDEAPEVQLLVLRKVGVLAAKVDLNTSELLPAITELAQDRQWRVREAFVANMPAVCESLGVEYFENNLLDLLLAAFTDHVNDVRSGAGNTLPELARVVGAPFVAQHIVPRLREFSTSATYYLQRTAVLTAVKALASSGDAAIAAVGVSMLDLVLLAAEDAVPNVRFLAAQTLQALVPSLDAAVVSGQVQPRLQELANDADDDVKHFGGLALEVC